MAGPAGQRFQAGGYTGLVNLTPVCGVLAVLAVALAARRAFGLLAGGLAGLLLATNMLEVWHAKYPSNEIFTQLLIGGALLGVVVALQTRWRLAAGRPACCWGWPTWPGRTACCCVLLAVAVGAALLVTDRFDGRAGWFAAGLAVALPYGFFQAYVLARRYTLANRVPDFPRSLAVIAGALALAVLLRRTAPGAGPVGRAGAGAAASSAAPGRRWWGWRRPAAGGVAAPMAVRPTYGVSTAAACGPTTRRRCSGCPGSSPPRVRAGPRRAGLVALRRWRAAAWALVLPAVCLLPLYAYRAEVSTPAAVVDAPVRPGHPARPDRARSPPRSRLG